MMRDYEREMEGSEIFFLHFLLNIFKVIKFTVMYYQK